MYQKDFADSYDRLGWESFSKNLYPRLKKHVSKNGSVLDIACGTGTLANLFAQDGYAVTAFDASEHMLRVAKKKNASVHFYKSTMEQFTYRKKFDLIVCAYDSINHIVDWSSFFTRVRNHLSENGVFVFDCNTIEGLRHWNGTYIQNNKEGTCIFSGTFNEKQRRAKLMVQCFVKDPNKNVFTNMNDSFESVAYPIEQVRQWLHQSGFSVSRFYPASEKEKGRKTFLCRPI